MSVAPLHEATVLMARRAPPLGANTLADLVCEVLIDVPLELLLDELELVGVATVVGVAVVVAAMAVVVGVGEAASTAPRVIGMLRSQTGSSSASRTLSEGPPAPQSWAGRDSCPSPGTARRSWRFGTRSSARAGPPGRRPEPLVHVRERALRTNWPGYEAMLNAEGPTVAVTARLDTPARMTTHADPSHRQGTGAAAWSIRWASRCRPGAPVAAASD